MSGADAELMLSSRTLAEQEVEEKRLAEEAKAKMSLADSGGVDEAAVAKVRELVAAGNPKKTADRVRKLDVEGGVPARMRVLLQVCAIPSVETTVMRHGNAGAKARSRH